MKRNWSDFYNEYKFYEGDFMSFMKNWMERNIPKEVLDKIAPPICENHEPILHSTGSIMYAPNGCTIMSSLVVDDTCKHCGAEIKPDKWVLK